MHDREFSAFKPERPLAGLRLIALYDQWLEEYRISFTLKDHDNVLYGLVKAHGDDRI
jgi:hypothetical protein